MKIGMNPEIIIAIVALLMSMLTLFTLGVHSSKRLQMKQRFKNTLQMKLRVQTVLEEANATVFKCRLQIDRLASSLSIPCPVSLEDSHKINTLLEDTVVACGGICYLFDPDTQQDIRSAIREIGRHVRPDTLNDQELENLINARLELLTHLQLLADKVSDKLEKLALD